MNDIELPPLPHWCEAGSPFAEQMQSYARAAIEADRAQRVPDGWKLVRVDALLRWKAAFAEELSAWDIDPPLHHVQTSHDEIDSVLSAPQPAPTQPAQAAQQKGRTISEQKAGFEQFWKSINPQAMSRRNLAKTAWNISHSTSRKNAMSIYDQFDGSSAENLCVLDIGDKSFLREIAAHAKERGELLGTTPAWQATYAALEASASMLADLIEQTEVKNV